MRISDIDAFLVGFPKAGTTSLAAWLDTSPAVRVSRPKETFAACPEFAENHRRAGGVDLATAFGVGPGEARPDALLLEASTLNVYSPSLRETLAGTDARVVVVVRDAASLVESWHEQMVFAGDAVHDALDEAWRWALAHDGDEAVDIKRRYATMFRTTTWIERWREAVGEPRLLVLRTAELADADALAARLGPFLGVDLDGLGPVPRTNERVGRGARVLRHLKVPAARRLVARLDPSGALDAAIGRTLRAPFRKRRRARTVDPDRARLHAEIAARLDGFDAAAAPTGSRS